MLSDFRSELSGENKTSISDLFVIRTREKGSVMLSWVSQAKELNPCALALFFPTTL